MNRILCQSEEQGNSVENPHRRAGIESDFTIDVDFVAQRIAGGIAVFGFGMVNTFDRPGQPGTFRLQDHREKKLAK